MFTSPGPIAFSIGPRDVHWYGIIIGLGIVCAYLFAEREIARRGGEKKHIESMLIPLVIAGVLGARLYYVLFNLSYYLARPLEILALWRGGLAIHGALIGGALAFFIYMRRHKLSWLLYADALMPGILLGQGIGRWGNFFNSEAFGGPTDLPWKLFIPENLRPAHYSAVEYFHPTFLYESLWNFVGFALLVILARKLYPKIQAPVAASHSHRAPGIVFFAYCIYYSLGRFFIEALRTDSLYIGPIRTAQLASVVLFVTGCIGLILIIRAGRMRFIK